VGEADRMLTVGAHADQFLDQGGHRLTQVKVISAADL
jgi:hypothetical protein